MCLGFGTLHLHRSIKYGTIPAWLIKPHSQFLPKAPKHTVTITEDDLHTGEDTINNSDMKGKHVTGSDQTNENKARWCLFIKREIATSKELIISSRVGSSLLRRLQWLTVFMVI